MKYNLLEFHDVKYLVPEGFEFLSKDIDEYPAFCGAGKGIGDKIVPEYIGGMRVSHTCHAHDFSWDESKPTFVDFILSNFAFGYNLFVYLSSRNSGYLKSKWKAFKGLIYFVSVSTVGWKIFKNLKRR
jgi:hypothetical protein